MKFEDIRKLQQKKFRDEAGWYLLEGEHLVQELQKAAVQEPRLRASEIYVTGEHAGWRSQLGVHAITTRQMAQISETRTPQGIVAVAPILPPAAPQEGERAIYLHEIQDPGNLGTILRTLAWFGKFRCLLSPDSVDLHNGKVVRASMGAIFHVPVEKDVPLDALSTRFRRLACLDLQGESITTPAFRECDCFIFGNEARGLPRAEVTALAARPFAISGTGVMESLNVAAAVTACQYELARNPD
ncbi:MAG: RNA methyltransferase [Pseudomonadota bacterium]|nr:RNA methyltransferase [Pseudomonadota bacterium]